MKKLIIACAGAIIFMATVAFAETKTGINAYNAGDYDTAFSELATPASQGDSDAQYYFGLLHANGNGTPLNELEAWMWFVKSGNKGHPLAQYELGKIYENGIGISADLAFAHMWYTLSAENNHAQAQTALDDITPKMNERDKGKSALMINIWRKKHQ